MTAKAIAIDGPAGAGKSTVAKIIAKRLGYLYIDTGAMYRAVAYEALKTGIAVDDEENLTRLASQMEIRLESDGDIYRVIGNGTDISGAIREPEVSAAASPVSAVPGVREALVAQQQRMATRVNVVMDGRDIGTKVLPDADCKVFLIADVMERAKRRTLELKERGIDANIDEVAAEIRERDERDSTRAHSPLKQAEDAILLDTTNLSIEQVVEAILAIHNS